MPPVFYRDITCFGFVLLVWALCFDTFAVLRFFTLSECISGSGACIGRSPPPFRVRPRLPSFLIPSFTSFDVSSGLVRVGPRLPNAAGFHLLWACHSSTKTLERPQCSLNHHRCDNFPRSVRTTLPMDSCGRSTQRCSSIEFHFSSGPPLQLPV